MKLKIGMISQGSNGDIEMMVALAFEFVRKGHDVELFVITINNRDYSFLNSYDGLTVHQKHIHSEIRNWDVEFWSKPDEIKDELFHKIYFSIEADLAHYANRFAQEKDLVFGAHHLFELSTLAEKFEIPYVAVNYPPEYIRSAYTAPFSLSHITDKSNEELWDIYESIFNARTKRLINRFRKQNGLLPTKNVLQKVKTSSFLNLIPYNKHICRPQPDWSDTYYVCGVLKESRDNNLWQPPQDLLDFVNTDDKPVFITTGSMVEYEHDVQKFQDLLLQAAFQINRKVIILSSWQNSEEVVVRNVYKLSGFISYPLVLKYCSVVVHHGGMGTLHHALEAGCPAVVITYGFDQPYNAKLLYDAGVSLGSIKREDLTAESLSVLIKQALANTELKKRAEALMKHFQEENNALNAVEYIERKLQSFYQKREQDLIDEGLIDLK